MRAFFYQKACLKALFLLICLFCGQPSFAQNVVAEQVPSVDIDRSDPTAVRALTFIGVKRTEESLQYHTMLNNLPHEDRVAFNRWISGIITPIRNESWEKEWNEHPESRPAFAAYIRHEITKNKLNLPMSDDDEKLFNDYLDMSRKFLEQYTPKMDALEKELNVPKELKELARNPKAYSHVGIVYSSYLTAKNLQKLAEHRKKEEEAAIAARKAIVPVDRNSQEYQDAFLSYKKAVASEKQVILTAQKNDPTWARAQYLLKDKGLGTLPVTSGLEKEFVKGLNDAKMKQFNKWKQCFAILTSIDTVEKEWKKEPNSHPAILFITNVVLSRMKVEEEGKVFNQASVDVKEMLKGDKTTVEKYISLMKQSVAESLPQMESLEKDLSITSKLRDAVSASVSDSTLFLFYDTYYRTFTPDKVEQAKRDVNGAIAKLNTLRPNWAAEEKTEFPDRMSWIMRQLGLNAP